MNSSHRSKRPRIPKPPSAENVGLHNNSTADRDEETRLSSKVGVIDIINAMYRQQDLLLRRQAQMVDDFLQHPSDRYSGPKERDVVDEIRTKEGPIKEMHRLSDAIGAVTKDLKQKRQALEDECI